jgi:hypothetical protein
MAARIAIALSYGLGIAGIAALLLVPGGGLLVASVWAGALIGVRLVVGVLRSRPERLWVGAIFALGCFLGAFEGGWYVLPAAIGFLVADTRRQRPPHTSLNGRAYDVAAAMGSAIAGWIVLAAFGWGPVYGSAGSGTDSAEALSLAAMRLTPRGEAFMVIAAALLAVVALSAIFRGRARAARTDLVQGAALAGLAVIAALGAMTIGVWLLPSIALGAISWILGRRFSAPSPATYG